MYFKGKNFKHEENSFQEALELNTEMYNVCRERVFFSHFANMVQGKELYGSEQLAPKEFTTVTGDLQRALSLVNDSKEYEITLLFFTRFHDTANKIASLWEADNNPNLSEEKRLEIKMLKLVDKLQNLREGENSDDREFIENLSVVAMLKRVEFAKKSKGSFSKYMELIGHPIDNQSSVVDDLINKIIKDQNSN